MSSIWTVESRPDDAWVESSTTGLLFFPFWRRSDRIGAGAPAVDVDLTSTFIFRLCFVGYCATTHSFATRQDLLHIRLYSGLVSWLGAMFRQDG